MVEFFCITFELFTCNSGYQISDRLATHRLITHLRSYPRRKQDINFHAINSKKNQEVTGRCPTYTFCSLKLFKNQAVFAFRRYEDSSLSYTGIDSHPKLRRYGLYDTVVAIDEDAG